MAKKTDVKSAKGKPADKPAGGKKKAGTAAAPQATHATYASNPDKLPPKSARAGDEDPAFASFTEGLKALDRKDWAKAVELFDRVIAVSDLDDLTARARQYRSAAEKQLPSSAKGDDADPYLQAVVEKNRGNLKAALDLARKGGRDKKDERFAFLAAAIHALENRPEEAAQALSQAVELNPKNRIHAFHDADFAELRKNRDYRHLFGLT
jgi:tetratricopeptide (TPR) repeat protein